MVPESRGCSLRVHGWHRPRVSLVKGEAEVEPPFRVIKGEIKEKRQSLREGFAAALTRAPGTEEDMDHPFGQILS